MEQKKVPGWRKLRPHVAVAVVISAVGLLISVMATPVVAAPPSQSPDEGRRIFQQICVACHTIGGGVRVGPDLQGVTGRRQESWLKVQIQSPSVHREQNDPISVANREKYGMSMPDLGLTAEQVEAVMAFLGAGAPTEAAIPDLYVPVLAAAFLALVALTFLGLRFGTKRVEVRP